MKPTQSTQSIQNLDLVTAVDLNYVENSKGKPVYHFIYSSQLYGTMFAVYAKFSGKEVKARKANAFEIQAISMRILNYRGCLNVGFTGHLLTEEVKPDIGITVGFTVKGACTVFEKDAPLKRPITVEKGKRQLVTFLRNVFPLPDYEGYLDERGDEKSKLLTGIEPPVSPWFDTEFNDRDGVDLYNTHYKEGMHGAPHRIVGFRCNSSRVNFYY